MITIFSISLFGYLLIRRNFSSIARDFAFSQQIVQSLSILNLVLISFITATGVSAPTLWRLIGILLITLKFFPLILRFFLIKRLRRALIPFLDCVILTMQTGRSFRISLMTAIENENGWVRNQLQELIESLQMPENINSMKCALLNDFMKELTEIDRSQSRCMEQVKALRRELKMQEDFRRRSGQVTQQIKMQAIIVTALYVCLLAFVIMQFSFKENQYLILAASLIFIVGLIWIFALGRKMKWKV